jgi:hypothetical protein
VKHAVGARRCDRERKRERERVRKRDESAVCTDIVAVARLRSSLSSYTSLHSARVCSVVPAGSSVIVFLSKSLALTISRQASSATCLNKDTNFFSIVKPM